METDWDVFENPSSSDGVALDELGVFITSRLSAAQRVDNDHCVARRRCSIATLSTLLLVLVAEAARVLPTDRRRSHPDELAVRITELDHTPSEDTSVIPGSAVIVKQ